ncbi:hypothetical protein RND81_05G218000 [Saponaria officinalis]|uniref:Uncharacterized protein n=1 Tax=Saponaria officinalis TaxID=3572 RepID=A0AAW1L0C8_SAPOF
MNDDRTPSKMSNLKKRFNRNPRKRSQNSDYQFRTQIHQQSSDTMEAKRVRFKGPKTGINRPRRSKFDGCSAPAEASEDAPMPVANGGEPKTSEFAYFKRLTQGVGCTSRKNLGNRKSIQERNFGPAYDGRGDANIVKDLEAPLCAKKSSTVDVGSFLRPQDVAIQSAGINSKVDYDTERLGSSPGIRTPPTVNLDNILSTSAAASLKSGIPLKDGDIFSSKRLKLQRWILKTMLLKADNHELPTECDVVSLLMSRLLPESSSKIPSDSKNHRGPGVKGQEHLHDSGIESEESWDGSRTLIPTNMDDFIGGVSADCQMIEDVNTFASSGADDMLVGFREGDKQGSSLYENESERWSDTFDDRNFLTWSSKNSDCSTQCKTSSNIFKNEVQDEFCYGLDNDQSCKFRFHTHSYELPTICYDKFLEHGDLDRTAPNSWHLISPERCGSSALGYLRDSAELDDFVENCRRSCLEYNSKRSDCKLDSRALDSWPPVSFETFGSPSLGSFSNSAELNEFEIRGEHSPLLLPWGTDDTNTEDDMDHEVYLPLLSEDDHRSFDSSTSLGIYPSIFPNNSMLRSSSDILPDTQHWLQPKDIIAGSSCAPFTLLYGPDDAVLFKDVFRGSRLYVVSEDLSYETGNILGDGLVPAAGLDFDIGLKSESLSHFIEPEYDVHYQLRQKMPSSQALYEDGTSLEMPWTEASSLMNVDIHAQKEVLLPLKLQRIRWLDTAVETNYDDLQISALGNVL